MRLDLIVGARPNFIKIAAIVHAITAASGKKKCIAYRLIHTGQHYDDNMSRNFFLQLGIPEPEINLNAGGGTQAEQTAAIMVGYERILLTGKPDLCMVVGDVTSTMACAIVARKMHVPVAHVEAGIRSRDWSMPEEINRVVTDSIANYFFTTSVTANKNLKDSGLGRGRVFFVGNTMIDTLLKNRSNFTKPDIWEELKLRDKQYLVMTLHRPANVDEEAKLQELLCEIVVHSRNLPLVFPVHPRTAEKLKNMSVAHPRLHMMPPLGYFEFNFLVERAMAVITDSGGITEETTVMGVPCMTLRENTERPETVTIGTNELLGTDPQAIGPAMALLFSGKWKKGNIPDKWDGRAAERIIDIILDKICE